MVLLTPVLLNSLSIDSKVSPSIMEGGWIEGPEEANTAVECSVVSGCLLNEKSWSWKWCWDHVRVLLYGKILKKGQVLLGRVCGYSYIYTYVYTHSRSRV